MPQTFNKPGISLHLLPEKFNPLRALPAYHTSLRQVLVYILIIFSLSYNAHAQEAVTYNLNMYNGLPSNTVYKTLVDRYGYLWIATDNGILKYNGYTLRKFDYEDGLSKIDVWDLYEDHKGRIWLSTIDRSIGYIHNDIFTSVYRQTDSISKDIYPSYLNETGDTVVFFNKIGNSTFSETICYIYDDTLHEKYITFQYNNWRELFFLFDSDIIRVSNDHVFVYDSQKCLSVEDIKLGNNILRVMTPNVNLLFLLSGVDHVRRYDNNLFFCHSTDTVVGFYNIKTNAYKKLSLYKDNKHEHLVRAFVSQNKFFALTDKNIFELDSTLDVTNIYNLNNLYNNSGSDDPEYSFFTASNFWGNILSTYNSGMKLNLKYANSFIKLNTPLTDYSFINSISDSIGYWWNKKKNILVMVKEGAIIKYYHLDKKITSVKKVVPVDEDKSILLNSRTIEWLYNDGRTEDMMKHIYYFEENGKKKRFDTVNNYQNKFLNYAVDALTIDSNTFYYLGSGHMGLSEIKLSRSTNTLHLNPIDHQRYNAVVPFKINNYIIFYTNEKVLIYNSNNGKKVFINKTQLLNNNIYKLENILIDNYDNIYFKDYNKLLMYDSRRNTFRQLLSNYNLINSFVGLTNNMLIIAGRFGVVQYRISGKNKLFLSDIYSNTKSILYNYINNIQFSKNSILLKTDKGIYIIHINSSSLTTTSYDDNKFVLTYKNNTKNINNNDTITFEQAATAADLDVIRPSGTGELNIRYKIEEDDYVNSSSGHMTLTSLKPGKYYKVSILANDNIWISSPLYVYIYVQPYWWQTTTVKRILWVLGLLALAGFVFIIILITRRVVTRANNRRNQRQELELKSIYSQINPHFIFNSLSTALYFVKKNKSKEAFDHISQFSQLLRAYIKSSRNKYISIADEVENLENYLHLQLSRFEQKFDYHIHIDNAIDPKHVKVPSLLLQPLVENALNHGIFHMEGKGLLDISFEKGKDNPDELVCKIEDNGIGRSRSKALRSELIKKADSYGTILIKELIDTFNKYEKITIHIEYIDKQTPETGTIVIVRIKNYQNA